MKPAKLPKESKDESGNTNEYILFEQNENKKYSIKINKIETGILIEANEISNSIEKYKIELGLIDFYQLSKGFKMFDTLEEICDALQNIFISKKVLIIKKSYFLIISLSINLIGGQEQEINIELNSETKTRQIYGVNIQKIDKLENELKEIKNDYKILLNQIKDLVDKIKSQNDESKKIKDKIKEQKCQIDEINNWKNKYDSELQRMNEIKINRMSLSRIDSLVITYIKELEFLENRLKNNEMLKKKNVVYKLLYRASRDGNDIKTFHKCCDNIMGTLSIVKTTKGMRFGGYTERLWNCSGSNSIQRKDNKDICFCFSLDLFKIYNFNENHKSSIYSDNSEAPYFYCSEHGSFFRVHVSNGKLFGITEYTTKKDCFEKFDNEYEINNGLKEFSVLELEVFQIIFDNN